MAADLVGGQLDFAKRALAQRLDYGILTQALASLGVPGLALLHDGGGGGRRRGYEVDRLGCARSSTPRVRHGDGKLFQILIIESGGHGEGRRRRGLAGAVGADSRVDVQAGRRTGRKRRKSQDPKAQILELEGSRVGRGVEQLSSARMHVCRCGVLATLPIQRAGGRQTGPQQNGRGSLHVKLHPNQKIQRPGKRDATRAMAITTRSNAQSRRSRQLQA